MTVLGISVGTARTGIAVLQDERLTDCRIHEFQATWTDDKRKEILQLYRGYVRKYGVTAIIVKVPPPNRHTGAVTALIEGIERIAKERYCEFDLITKSEIKGRLCLQSTDDIVQYAKLLYPELSSLYRRGAGNQHAYNKKAFEAALGAHLFQQRLPGRRASLPD